MNADSPPTSTPPQRWARCRPGTAWRHPALPKEWVRVLEWHSSEGLAHDQVPAEGYVWLDMPGEVRHVPARDLEFRENPSDVS